MPIYDIVGADRDTGKEIRLSVPASNFREAEDHVARHGVLIAEMHERASPATSTATVAGPASMSAPAHPPIDPGIKLYGDPMICPNPNCGYVGQMRRKPQGSWAIAILLLLLWVLPGVIYLLVYSGFDIVCPRCGMKVGKAGPSVA